jgi:plasmid stabilization system protein ParE
VRWLEGLHHRIDTLERFPARGSAAREREYFKEDLRQLLFKSHRIIFWIDASHKAIYVLHVRHTKQRAVGQILQD